MRQIPCAGCAKHIYVGQGSLPEGQATCRGCRREGKGPTSQILVTCETCGAKVRRDPSEAARFQRHFCSLACRARAGAAASPRAGLRRRPSGVSRRAADRARCAARRARIELNFIEFVDPDVIYIRDGWRCHICGKRVDKRLSGRAAMGPTLDHLIPIAAGGEHSYRNTALAHRRCNSRKGATGPAQLLLVG